MGYLAFGQDSFGVSISVNGPSTIDFINIGDPEYGLAGDGITDDTADLQALINGISSSGAVLYVPNKTFLINGTGSYGITISNKTKLRITGPGTLKCGALTSTFIYASGCNKILFDGSNGLTIDGDNKAAVGIEITTSSDPVIKHCNIKNLTDARTTVSPTVTAAGIRLSDGCTYAKILYNTIENIQALYNDLNAGGVGDANSSVGIWVCPRSDGTNGGNNYPNPTTHFLFEGNTIRNILPPDPSVPVSGKMLSNADGIKISAPYEYYPASTYSINVRGKIVYNDFYNCDKRSVKVFPNGVLVEGNQSYLATGRSSFAGVSIYGNECTVRDNTFEANSSSYYANCIEIQSGRNIKLINNRFVHQSNATGQNVNCVLVQNATYPFNSGATAATAFRSMNLVIEDNVFYQGKYGVYFAGAASGVVAAIEGVIIRNNTWNTLDGSVINIANIVPTMTYFTISDNKAYNIANYFLNIGSTVLGTGVIENNTYQVLFNAFATSSFTYNQRAVVYRDNVYLTTVKDYLGNYQQYRDPDYVGGVGNFVTTAADLATSIGIQDVFHGWKWIVGDRLLKAAPASGDYNGMSCTVAGIYCTRNWAISTAYLATSADYHVIANGNVYRCVQAGTSAASGTGPTGTGASIVDGTARWTYVAPLAVFKTYGLVS